MARNKKATTFAAAALIVLNASSVHAYSRLGHMLTGDIAQYFLTPKTSAQIATIIPADYDGLGDAATWADAIRFLDQYKWASPMHFVNSPNDNPPTQCVFDYIYGGQDNVNAIFNTTATLKQFEVTPPKTAMENKTREEALKFLIHFIADIHQPLHDSTPFQGGNNAPVKFGKATSNLHALWDTLILGKDTMDRFGNDLQAYLNDTIKLTKTIWESDVNTWTICADNQPANPWSNVTDQIKTVCPIQWAIATNALNCEYVWKDYSPTRDYSTDYFQTVTGPGSGYLYQRQLAMSGVRIAAVLNEIYDPASVSVTKRNVAVPRNRRAPAKKRLSP
ncbi:hypothetical protein FBU30_001349 [Linnemannia zychae]|nr:hypothetical protein FBU30_001349 [Linnemannia zychae]